MSDKWKHVHPLTNALPPPCGQKVHCNLALSFMKNITLVCILDHLWLSRGPPSPWMQK